MTVEEEGRAFERRARIQLHVHRALGRSASIAGFFAELVAVHAQELPEHDWTPFRALEVDEPLSVRPPVIERGGLLFGVVHRDDLVVGSTESTAASPFVQWPGLASLERIGSVASLGRACFEGERAPRHDGFTLLDGYVAKLASVLLARHPGRVDVFVGHHQSTPLWIGRLDEVGFVPTPLPIAAAHLRDQRARYVAGLAAMQGPRVAVDAKTAEVPHDLVRALRHPDGRRWQVGVRGDRLELRFTDEDGDEHVRTRTSTDPLWEAEAMIRDQHLEGFVD